MSENEKAAAAQAQPPRPSQEFMDKWQLVSADKDSQGFGKYQREGESNSSGNVGMWYSSACYWRLRSEYAEKQLGRRRDCGKQRVAAPKRRS